MFGVLFTLLVSVCSPQGKIVSCFSYLICTYMPVVYIRNRYIYCWLVSALLEFTFVTGHSGLWIQVAERNPARHTEMQSLSRMASAGPTISIAWIRLWKTHAWTPASCTPSGSSTHPTSYLTQTQ